MMTHRGGWAKLLASGLREFQAVIQEIADVVVVAKSVEECNVVRPAGVQQLADVHGEADSVNLSLTFAAAGL